MEILRDKTKINLAYTIALKQYILDNQAIYFSDENRADSYSDVRRFPNMKTNGAHLAMPTQPILIDRSHEGEHMYCICTISENNKITSQIPVIRISELDQSLWRNGYFLLPELEVK